MTARITDTIAAHRGRERGMVCDEGELWCDAYKAIIAESYWADHVLAALKAQRITIVELPAQTIAAALLAAADLAEAVSNG